MWIVVMFDLPTDTDAAKRDYRIFRETLLGDGFVMLQFSVYSRHCASYENLDVHVSRVKSWLPPDGHVRVFTFTDKQFQKQLVFYGKIRTATQSPAEQLTLF
jgi:CRISPR-associated protein Cas2